VEYLLYEELICGMMAGNQSIKSAALWCRVASATDRALASVRKHFCGVVVSVTAHKT